MTNSTKTSAQGGDLAAQIQRLLDIEAIRSLQYRYATLVDEAVRRPGPGGAAAVADLFTAEATADYGPMGVLRGRDDIVRHYEVTIPGQLAWAMHFITNPVIEVIGGHAAGEWYFHALAVVRADPVGGPRPFSGRYTVNYSDTSEGWKISALVARFEQP